MNTEEHKRLHTTYTPPIHPWKKWGTYLSERSWGNVREDYSNNGDAWNYFPHDAARSRAYRWGDDGLAGFCDQYQLLIFSFAFWNQKDPILKERLFGLNSTEGNHGEDVKESYFYLDGTPTHSYMKYLYKYPQSEFPYKDLVEKNKKRTAKDPEYELIDTGVFDQSRYFDIFIEYAKNDPDDTAIRIEIFNRGDLPASIDALPQLWFRNRWSWTSNLTHVPEIKEGPKSENVSSLFADSTNHAPMKYLSFEYQLEPMYLYGDTPSDLLFTNNETNSEHLFGPNAPNRTPHVKDAFHRFIIKNEDCINLEKKGTKAAFHYKNINIEPGKSKVLRLRLSNRPLKAPLEDVDSIITLRKKEADEFYTAIHLSNTSDEDKKIQRQALAGMLWSKQFYFYDVKSWLKGDNPYNPPLDSRRDIRNTHWEHLSANNVISMPDKWEYPWFASWDLAFHSVALSLVDFELAKDQIHLVLSHLYQHPNGQIPAYEWEFSNLNPPVQAWALRRIYSIEKERKLEGDHDFLKRCFLKLMNNFGWWVNKVDKEGNNFFEGGFLGLDNISVLDRDKPLSSGGHLEESDGTGWMGFFSLNMLKIALELSKKDPIFEGLAICFFEYFVYVAIAMQPNRNRPVSMWDEQDGFFYDILSYPTGEHQALKIRSFVGVIPFYSLDFLEEEEINKLPKFHRHFTMFLKNNAEMTENCVSIIEKDGKKTYLFSLMKMDQMKRFLQTLFDPQEFFSDYGLRSLSKFHENHPLFFEENQISYEPGESLEKIKGGNSNWRGPIWLPTNFLVLCSLLKLRKALGDNIEFEIGGTPTSLKTLSDTLQNRLIDLFRKNSSGKRPSHGDCLLFKDDPFWKDLILFYEHYHGDTGRGLGASHQTGWSGLVANLIANLE